MRKDDLVHILEPHWAAGVSGLLVREEEGSFVVAIQWEGALKEVKVPYEQIFFLDEKDNH